MSGRENSPDLPGQLKAFFVQPEFPDVQELFQQLYQ